jgi:hypothetical protein
VTEVKPTGKVHPVAEFFPLMDDVELKALADDIKANGLRQPLVLDGDGNLLDGRNRLAACKLAKVKPDYESVDGDDPLAVVVSLNVRRRNLTGGQKAIAAAEAWELFPTGSRSDPKKAQLAAMFDINDRYVQQARALVERDPVAAGAVKRGEMSLGDAHDELRKREGRNKSDAAEHRRLRASYPDLAEAVDAESTSLREALAEADERTAREKQTRWAATSNVLDALGYFDASSDPDSAQQTVALFDPELAAQTGREITPERLRRAAAYASALADALEDG